MCEEKILSYEASVLLRELAESLMLLRPMVAAVPLSPASDSYDGRPFVV